MSEPGMLDMLKQARDLQKKMSKVQKRVEKMEVTADAGAGMVTVVITGKLKVKTIAIEPSLIASGDARMIQDLVASAVNAAITQAQEMIATEMKQATGGLSVPGLF